MNEQAEHTLEGSDFTLVADEDRFSVIEQAFDYRGDVTVFCEDGRKIEGFLFDRRQQPQPLVRMMPNDGGRVEVPYSQIVRISFSGRDCAFGRGWDAWVKKHEQLKAKGEEASIEAESLE